MLDIRPAAGAQVVEDRDLVSPSRKGVGEVRSDETSSARDQVSRRDARLVYGFVVLPRPRKSPADASPVARSRERTRAATASRYGSLGETRECYRPPRRVGDQHRVHSDNNDACCVITHDVFDTPERNPTASCNLDYRLSLATRPSVLNPGGVRFVSPKSVMPLPGTQMICAERPWGSGALDGALHI